jgi:hypothetical protein
MLLGEGKHANDHEACQDKSGYDILHHGYHSGQSFGDVLVSASGPVAADRSLDMRRAPSLNPSARSSS